jgi:hypothetical protein
MMLMIIYRKIKKPGYRLFLLVVFLCIQSIFALAQNGLTIIPFEKQFFDALEGKQYAGSDKGFSTSVKPLMRRQLQLYTFEDTLMKAKGNWLRRKLFDEHLIDQKGEDWSLQADLLAELQLGRELTPAKITWQNTRGARLQGSLGNKIAFYSSLYENQAVFPTYLDSFIRQTGVIPGQGLGRIFGNGWDFGNAEAVISYAPATYLNFQFGQGRHFIGEGYRSMLLSDIGLPAPFFRLQAEFGPIQYTYWLQNYTDINQAPLAWSLGYRQKYAAMGFLNWQINKKLTIGAFQAVVWQADDTIAGRKPIPFQYLNPVIFFHPVQFSSGSEGNLLLGFNLKYRLLNRMIVYGQLMLDELSVRDFLRQNGAIINKYGGQIGWKAWQPFGLKGIFLQSELNFARPYTYSHWSSLSNYAHYGQPLAHPFGANFKELVGIMEYQFLKVWALRAKSVWISGGLDSAGLFFGQDVFQNYLLAPGGIDAKGVQIGQGLPITIWHNELVLSRLVNPKTNLQIEARALWRRSGIGNQGHQTLWLMIGVRSALRNLYNDF